MSRPAWEELSVPRVLAECVRCLRGKYSIYPPYPAAILRLQMSQPESQDIEVGGDPPAGMSHSESSL